jgi:hypothetical protein
LNNRNEGNQTHNPIENPSWYWRLGFISYVKRKMDERKAKRQKESPTDRAARVTANATAWIAFFTLVSVGVSVGTFLILRQQLSEMHDSGVDTHTLAQAADTQAKKMSNVSDAADKIRQAADDMVTQDQRIADNAHNSLEASDRQSRTALEASSKQSAASLGATVASSHLDQRAWLVPSGFKLSEEPTLGIGVTVTVSIINTGKTPALELINQSKLFFLNIDPPQTNFDLPVNPRSRAIVAPGASGVEFQSDSMTLKTLSQMGFYTNLSYKIYLEALIRYKDTFNQDHWTTVCAYHVSGAPLSTFQYCEHGNEVDEEGTKNPN